MSGYPEESSDFDIQECARWNCYCSLKEILNQDVFMKYYGNGDFESFNEAIDKLNRGE